ncbi:hypothetical protein E6C76_01610 [Pseudothauera nasutitermitis]|uniref:Restriction endonuclease n=1 Tax=Pseudothauera nasutitermitis TaxID=2565930 RepID=A0A4S4B376_9RHOO|nr:hypothetical protein [Pseudothauera nasutitermitis]THF67110.1 hypothetical protein E6C76_01610 [Pseudothauera nasutitermitis]
MSALRGPLSDLSSPGAILGELEHYLSAALRAGDLRLSNAQGDGRSNSSEDERRISSALRFFAHANQAFKQHGLSIEIAPPRCWYDFLVRNEDESVWLPVNVKVTAMRGQDNISSKEGLFYAVTGIRPERIGLNNWERYCEAVAEHLDPDTTADYYFLVVSKNDVGHVFWTSLKQINRVVPNGNNPPFQCAWRDNQVRVERPPREAVARLLGVLGETFRLRAEAWRYYGEILAPRVNGLEAD